jgi:hypothetical protein
MKHVHCHPDVRHWCRQPASVQADINVGVIVGATGPGASLGIPYKNAFSLLPATIGRRKGALHHPRRRH